MDRCRRLAERLYNIENPVGPQPSTNRSQPSSAADPTLAAIIIFFKSKRREFGAACEIFVEFVFLLCENGLVPGSVTRPTGRIQ